MSVMLPCWVLSPYGEITNLTIPALFVNLRIFKLSFKSLFALFLAPLNYPNHRRSEAVKGQLCEVKRSKAEMWSLPLTDEGLRCIITTAVQFMQHS